VTAAIMRDHAIAAFAKSPFARPAIMVGHSTGAEKNPLMLKTEKNPGGLPIFCFR